jgi:osmotically-inducible protein OsmY
MSPFRRRGCSWLLCSLLVLACGCSSEDAAHLARLGKQTAAKVGALAGGPDGRLAVSWHAVQGQGEGPALETRVAARLRWDKTLAALPIEIHAVGGTVELRGTLPDLVQRRRAVELAESTIGVERVVDGLEVPALRP